MKGKKGGESHPLFFEKMNFKDCLLLIYQYSALILFMAQTVILVLVLKKEKTGPVDFKTFRIIKLHVFLFCTLINVFLAIIPILNTLLCFCLPLMLKDYLKGKIIRIKPLRQSH